MARPTPKDEEERPLARPKVSMVKVATQKKDAKGNWRITGQNVVFDNRGEDEI